MTTIEPAALRRLRFAWTAAVVAGAISPAVGQVQITGQRVAPFTNLPSRALAVGDGRIGGSIVLGDEQPVIWNDNTLNLLSLPNAATGGNVTAIGDGYAAGRVSFGTSATIATIWVGAAQTPVQLNPTSEAHAVITAARGSQQVGFTGGSAVNFPTMFKSAPARASDFVTVQALSARSVDHPAFAGVWNSTAQSFQNIHPPGVHSSVALDTDGTTQVGLTNSYYGGHAARWNGTAGSWTDIHGGPYLASRAHGVDGDDIVGAASEVYAITKPVIWKDGAISPVELMLPSQYFSGTAADIRNGVTVGTMFDINNSNGRAVLWINDGAEVFDLHPFLTPGFVLTSSAQEISFDGQTYTVVGFAEQLGNPGLIPVSWTIRIPESTTAFYLLLGGRFVLRRKRSIK